MSNNKIKTQKTFWNWNWMRTFAAVMLIAGMLIATVAPAEAKTYYYTSSGNYAVRYNNEDIVQWLRPYIDHLEYDLVSMPKVGARLYFTGTGKYVAKYDSGASAMAKYIMSMPEWTPSRSEKSVIEEIKYHAWWPYKWIVHIEYYCADLQSWEVYKVYC